MSKYEGELSILHEYIGSVDMDLFLNNQNLVVLDGLKAAALDGLFLNSATTTSRLVTLTGTTLSSATLSFVSGSAGRYEGVLPVITSLVEGTEYLLKVTAVSSIATVAFWQQRVIARQRRV